jgi:hypothetical protein
MIQRVKEGLTPLLSLMMGALLLFAISLLVAWRSGQSV